MSQMSQLKLDLLVCEKNLRFLEEENERLKAENAALKEELKTAYFMSGMFEPVRWMRP